MRRSNRNIHKEQEGGFHLKKPEKIKEELREFITEKGEEVDEKTLDALTDIIFSEKLRIKNKYTKKYVYVERANLDACS